MNYHNPENLTEWGQSDGWRIRLVGEPLPEDAECFHNGTWILAENADLPDWTYRTRKPLPVSPLIAQLDAEIKALEEKKAVALAVEAGAEWEYSANGAMWHNPVNDLGYYIKNFDYQFRLKPKPVTRPWSFETRPRGVAWVFKKGCITDRMITAWRDDGVEIGEYDKPSYQELYDNWLQRDGSICGETTEEAK